MSYFLAFLGFAALIILHEFGHFAVAKAVGMRVERFSLFFGPMLWKVRRGETEYGIAAIPLGGYVKITGMNPNEDIPPEAVPRAYYNQPVWKRVVVILAGPAMNLLIAFVIVTSLYWSEGNLSHQVTTRTVAAGVLERPAASYLKPGDKIVAVDGKRNLSIEQITKQIGSHTCQGKLVAGCRATTPATITVNRGGKVDTFRIFPVYDATAGVKRMRVGFTFGTRYPPLGLGGAVGQGASELWYWTHKTVSTVVQVFEPKERKQLHSVVGGFEITKNAIGFSTTAALLTLALISLSLAIINLFPFLPLDGGHVFWALAEKVRGRRIPFAVMERAGVIGFALIMLVFVIGLSNDISTLTGQGFNHP
jgi:regulator of sigma E protease